MAFDVLALKNPNTGEIKMAPVGFSWTVLFFSFMPPAIRSDWKHFIIIGAAAFLTSGLAGVLFAFIYNKIYIKHLIYDKGFKVTGVRSNDLQRVANELGLELPLFSRT